MLHIVICPIRRCPHTGGYLVEVDYRDRYDEPGRVTATPATSRSTSRTTTERSSRRDAASPTPTEPPRQPPQIYPKRRHRPPREKSASTGTATTHDQDGRGSGTGGGPPPDATGISNPITTTNAAASCRRATQNKLDNERESKHPRFQGVNPRPSGVRCRSIQANLSIPIRARSRRWIPESTRCVGEITKATSLPGRSPPERGNRVSIPINEPTHTIQTRGATIHKNLQAEHGRSRRDPRSQSIHSTQPDR